MKTLRVTAEMLAALVADCARDLERERCGLIGGRAGVGCALYPIDNIARDPASAFYLEPHQQIDAMRRMRRAREALFGIYHSHPRTDPRPSARDRAFAAYPGVGYFIVSLTDSPPRTAAYVFDGEDFEPRAIETMPADPAGALE